MRLCLQSGSVGRGGQGRLGCSELLPTEGGFCQTCWKPWPSSVHRSWNWQSTMDAPGDSFSTQLFFPRSPISCEQSCPPIRAQGTQQRAFPHFCHTPASGGDFTLSSLLTRKQTGPVGTGTGRDSGHTAQGVWAVLGLCPAHPARREEQQTEIQGVPVSPPTAMGPGSVSDTEGSHPWYISSTVSQE